MNPTKTPEHFKPVLRAMSCEAGELPPSNINLNGRKFSAITLIGAGLASGIYANTSNAEEFQPSRFDATATCTDIDGDGNPNLAIDIAISDTQNHIGNDAQAQIPAMVINFEQWGVKNNNPLEGDDPTMRFGFWSSMQDIVKGKIDPSIIKFSPQIDPNVPYEGHLIHFPDTPTREDVINPDGTFDVTTTIRGLEGGSSVQKTVRNTVDCYDDIETPTEPPTPNNPPINNNPIVPEKPITEPIVPPVGGDNGPEIKNPPVKDTCVVTPKFQITFKGKGKSSRTMYKITNTSNALISAKGNGAAKKASVRSRAVGIQYITKDGKTAYADVKNNIPQYKAVTGYINGQIRSARLDVPKNTVQNSNGVDCTVKTSTQASKAKSL